MQLGFLLVLIPAYAATVSAYAPASTDTGVCSTVSASAHTSTVYALTVAAYPARTDARVLWYQGCSVAH
eukprot:300804-Rhodomonas_salina.1